MKKFAQTMNQLQMKAFCALNNFKTSERGDTNFISLLLILGIVVVLAGGFLLLGKNAMNIVTQKVTSFLNSL